MFQQQIQHFSTVFIQSHTRQRFFHQVFRRQNLCTSAIVSTLLFGIGNSAVAADFEAIAYTGQLAVGAPPGSTHHNGFRGASDPALGDDSSVYYSSGVAGIGTANGSGEGLWRGNRNGTVAFWIQGDPAPGTNQGVTFSRGSTQIVPNGMGQTAFTAHLTGATSSNNFGIWAGAPGALGLVAREGNPAPGTNSTFTGDFSRLVYNNAGQVAFQDRFEGNNRSGIWTGTPGSIQAIALEDAQAPGFGPGVTFGDLSLENRPLALNNNGTLAFYSKLSGPPGFDPDTIWTGTPGAISAVVVADQVAPGTGGKLFTSLNDSVDINNNGEIGFRAKFSGDTDSAWFGDPNNLSLIAQEGDSAPGLENDVIFKSFGNPLINDQGKFALLATIGTTQSLNSLWFGSDQSLELIAKQGDQVLEFADATIFKNFTSVLLNNRGQVAFDALLSGTESGHAIFATDGSDEYSLIAKIGDIVDLDGESRTIRGLSLLDYFTGSSDGRPSSFNDKGDLMFYASFEEGGSGIFLANVSAVPLPPAVMLFVSGLFGLLGLRRLNAG